MKIALLTALVAAALGLAACGSGSDATETPVACLSGAATFARALDAVPGPVRLEDGTPISDCVPAEQKAGDLATVGTALVRTANELNEQARRAPGGKTNLALGYLLGALRQGNGQVGGVSSDLVRRVDAAARYSPGGKVLAPRFDTTLARGEALGTDTG